MTKEEAIALSESRFWETMAPRERAIFQMYEEKLCMPFDVFHASIEEALGRPVFTHEFGLNPNGLRNELMNGAPAPSMEDIMNLIPEDKRVVLVVAD